MNPNNFLALLLFSSSMCLFDNFLLFSLSALTEAIYIQHELPLHLLFSLSALHLHISRSVNLSPLSLSPPRALSFVFLYLNLHILLDAYYRYYYYSILLLHCFSCYSLHTSIPISVLLSSFL